MTQRFFFTLSIICFFSCFGEVVPTAAQQVDASETLQNKLLIQQLGHRSFSMRQQAFDKLIEIGEPALDALRKAKAHKSAEVRYRVRALIKEIRRATLYTVTCDGRLIRLRVGQRNIEQEVVAKLGAPLDQPRFKVKGLAMSPTGVLYATAGCPRSLYRIDPKDGATITIGVIGSVKVNGLAFGAGGKLYGVNSSCANSQTTPFKQLIVIDIETGMPTSANVEVNIPQLDALAIDSGDRAAIVDGCYGLFELDLRDRLASESLVMKADFDCVLRTHDGIQGMCYAADRALFGVCNKQNSFLVRLDPKTGVVTNYGHLGFGTRNLAADHEREVKNK
jgi:hypothetical protein